MSNEFSPISDEMMDNVIGGTDNMLKLQQEKKMVVSNYPKGTRVHVSIHDNPAIYSDPRNYEGDGTVIGYAATLHSSLPEMESAVYGLLVQMDETGEEVSVPPDCVTKL